MSRHVLTLPGRHFARGDYVDTWQRQIAFAFISSTALCVAWLASASPLVVIAIPAAILGIIVAIMLPYPLTLLYFTIVYLKIPDISPILAPLNQVLSALSVLVSVSLIWHGIIGRSVLPYAFIRVSMLHALLLLFWVLITLNLPFAYVHSYALQSWSDFSKLLFLSLAIPLFLQENRHLQTAAQLFTMGGVVISVSTIYHYYTGTGLVEGSRATAGEGFLGNPNDLALILLLPLSFAASSLRAGSRFTALAWNFVAAVIILAGVVYTQSRGGLLGVVAVLTVIGSRFVKSKVLVIACSVALGGLLWSASDISSRISGGAQDVKGESAQDRIYAWRAGTNMALHHPLTGVGIGNFTAMFQTYAPVTIKGQYTAHSIWFLVLGENGLPSFLIFVSIIILCFRVNISTVRCLTELTAPAEMRAFAGALSAALGGFCVAGSFDSFSYQWALYVILSFTVSLARLADRTASRRVGEGRAPAQKEA